MKKCFCVEFYVDVEIPDDTIATVVKDFQGCIDSRADIHDIMKHIAWNEASGGGFCEGVGENGKDFIAKIKETDIEESALHD